MDTAQFWRNTGNLVKFGLSYVGDLLTVGTAPVIGVGSAGLSAVSWIFTGVNAAIGIYDERHIYGIASAVPFYGTYNASNTYCSGYYYRPILSKR